MDLTYIKDIILLLIAISGFFIGQKNSIYKNGETSQKLSSSIATLFDKMETLDKNIDKMDKKISKIESDIKEINIQTFEFRVSRLERDIEDIKKGATIERD